LREQPTQAVITFSAADRAEAPAAMKALPDVAEIPFTKQWIERVRVDGDWNRPPAWSVEDILASPWPESTAMKAMEALSRLFDSDTTRRIFATPDSNLLWERLAMRWALSLSPLFSLGVDLIDADAWRYTSLIDRLRIPAEHEGARLELAILAGLQRAGQSFEYEPLRGTGVNPDFGIEIGGSRLYLDTKKTKESVRFKQDWRFFLSLTRCVPHGVNLSLTDKFENLQREDEGRRWIEQHVDRLGVTIEERARALLAKGEFPSVDDVEGLVRLELAFPPGQTGSSNHRGTPMDGAYEARRIVHGAIQSGARQIPRDELGVLLVDLGFHGTITEIQHEIERWMREEGAGYSNLIGILVVGDVFHENAVFDALVPVWRDNASAAIRESSLWSTLQDDINWQRLDVHEWRKRSSRTQ